jgi:hypothetical protein
MRPLYVQIWQWMEIAYRKRNELCFPECRNQRASNNFFSDSYWGKNEDGTFIVATMSDPDGSATTDELRNGRHTVRCVKLRYPPVG